VFCGFLSRFFVFFFFFFLFVIFLCFGLIFVAIVYNFYGIVIMNGILSIQDKEQITKGKNIQP